MNESATILSLDDLRVDFDTREGPVHAVRGVSWSLAAGQTLAVVGESGSGKSVSALAVLGLIPRPPGRIAGGRIAYRGQDILGMDAGELRRLRGNRIAMIFQEPMTSLNPVLRIGEQIAEGLRVHQGLDRPTARQRALDMLRLVQIPEPERRLDAWPHELSGGMRQRVMIALALACGPDVLIADEPTTALDVTIQAQILDVLRDIKTRLGTSIVLITHDLGVVAEMADRVVVLYAGQVVEEGPVRAVLRRPTHPYTLGLLGARPELSSRSTGPRRTRLTEIPGTVPSLREPIIGCAFAPRCALASARCRAEAPVLEARGAGQRSACWHADQMEIPV